MSKTEQRACHGALHATKANSRTRAKKIGKNGKKYECNNHKSADYRDFTTAETAPTARRTPANGAPRTRECADRTPPAGIGRAVTAAITTAATTTTSPAARARGATPARAQRALRSPHSSPAAAATIPEQGSIKRASRGKIVGRGSVTLISRRRG